MAKFVEVDVRGLSCPEPVLLTMDAMEARGKVCFPNSLMLFAVDLQSL